MITKTPNWYVHLGNADKAEFTGTTYSSCTSCDEAIGIKLYHPSEFDFDDVDKLLFDLDWIRRKFNPDSTDFGFWFCSKECAYNSNKAKELEEYWKNYQEKETKKKTFWQKVVNFFRG